MPKITFAKILPVIEASVFVTSIILSFIFPPMAAVCCGVSLASLSLKLNDQQKTVLMGGNPNEAIAVGYTQIMMCSFIFITLLLLTANPIFAPIIPFIPVAWAVCIGITALAAMRAGGYKNIHDTWTKSNIRPLVFIINVIDFCLDPINSTLGLIHKVLDFSKNKSLSASKKLFSKRCDVSNKKHIQKNIIKIKLLLFISSVFAFCANHIPKNTSEIAEFAKSFKIVKKMIILGSIINKHVAAPVKKIFVDLLNKSLPMLHNGLTAALKKLESVNQELPAHKRSYLRFMIKARGVILRSLSSRISAVLKDFPKTTADISQSINNFTLQNWLGTFYFTAQVGLFAAISVLGAPLLGVAALSYVALSSIDEAKLLPGSISIVLEKFNGWVGFAAGIFISDPLMTIYTFYNIAAYFVIKVALPSVSKIIFGKSTNVLTVGKQGEIEEIKPIIPSDVNKDDFEVLLEMIDEPELENRNTTGGMSKDIEILMADFYKFKDTYEVIQTRKRVYNKFERLRGSAYFTDKIKYYIGYIPMNIYWYSISAVYNLLILKEFLKQKNKDQAYGLTTEHILNVPIVLPEADPEVDFKAFMELVNSSELDSESQINISECLGSSAFKKKYPEFEGKDVEQQKEFSTQYIKSGMRNICHMINTGEGLTFDKTIEGQNYIKKLGKHVIKYCHDLLNIGETTTPFAIFRELTIGVAERCPKALEQGLFVLCQEYVWNKLVADSNMSCSAKVAVNMQTLRTTKFDELYFTMAANDSLQATFFFVDFKGTHDKSSIEDSMVGLNLKNVNNVQQTDVSSKNNDILKEIAINLMAYSITSLLITCENGYSIKAIINHVIKEFDCAEQSNSPRSMQLLELFNEWSQSFQADGVSEYIHDINSAVTFEPTSEEIVQRNKLVTLFLIDMGVLKFNDIAKKQKVDEFFKPENVSIRKNDREHKVIYGKLANMSKDTRRLELDVQHHKEQIRHLELSIRDHKVEHLIFSLPENRVMPLNERANELSSPSRLRSFI